MSRADYYARMEQALTPEQVNPEPEILAMEAQYAALSCAKPIREHELSGDEE